MPLISVNKVSKSYHSRLLLDHVSFSIEKGDKIALIGSNGTGKSTLFKMIRGDVKPDEGEVLHHGTAIAGYLTQNMEELDMGGNILVSEEIQSIEDKMREAEYKLATADAENSQSLLRTYEQLTSRFEALGGYDYEPRMKAALAGLGLTDIDFTRDISSFSGGEKMRICLARLIVSRPDILLLDEPTNHLDTDALEWLEGFIRSYGGAVLLISHDRYFIDKTVTKVLELENSTITAYRGNYTDYKEQKLRFIEDQKRLVANLEKELVRQEGVTQTMLSHRNISGYHAREKVVEKLSDRLASERSKLSGGPLQMSFKLMPELRAGDPEKILLQTRNLGKTFPDGKVLFRDVNFEIKACDKMFLVGPNGCGKTTMLSLLLGRISEFDGDVLISGSSRIGYMGQFVPFEDETRTILDELMERSELGETSARNLLARFGFRDIDVYKQISVLSGGERSRLFLCCLLEEKPELLFLDEPTNHLDIESREVLEDALADYNGAILAVSHDRYFIEKCQSKIIGFFGDHVEQFDKYEFYRRKYRTFVADEESKRAAVLSEQRREEKERREAEKKEAADAAPKAPSVNRAKERKEIAKRKERIKYLEKTIAELEEEQKTLEASFGKDTSKEDYDRYAKNSETLEEMYAEYMELENT
ncbi:MAG: ABC-F family ATP-binding cassette domain-containing protein [Clostridiales bacterium]|nr:ABC-F family ATP-binding cassette domain-containing protein [Clostridiales bacterium]